jgi:Ca-activated chloride channel family protein
MSFAHPGWLALLILIPVLGLGAILASRLRRKQWTEFVAPRLRGGLLKRSSPLPRWLALVFLLAACAVITAALARPRGDAGTRTEKTIGRNVMIALDISKSMKVTDVKPDRLSQAKALVYELLESMPNERIGFLGFAGTPCVYAPLTIDHSAVREIVDQIDEKWAPLGGSDLAGAVKLATETLKKTGQKNNALVILSDGEKHEGDLDAMISEAERAGVYIVSIGIGTEDGGYVPNPDFPDARMIDRAGRAVISRLQPDVMRKLAEGTKGRFVVASSGLDIPAIVRAVTDGMDAFEMDGRERRISIEFYQWLLLPGIFFLIISIVAGTRWRGVQKALCLALGFLTISNAEASDANLAKEALAREDYPQARALYHELAESAIFDHTQARYRLGEATAAYRAQEFRDARTAYSQALLSTDPEVLASGHLGMGNSLFQLGWKSLTTEAYPSDPGSIPDLARFDTIFKEALAKSRESETPDAGDTGGFTKIEAIITNWADSVRHYESSLRQSPENKAAKQNRDLAWTYLKRIEELLKQEEEETRQAMPQSGDGPPQEGQGDGEGEEKGEKQPGEKGKGDEDPKDGKGGDKEPEKEGENGKNKDKGKDEKDGDKDGADPNESPKERAHRILKENADLEKGPLSPGRREFRDAEKDW